MTTTSETEPNAGEDPYYAHPLADFLNQRTIGPATSIGKLCADVDLTELLQKLPSPVRERAFAAALGTYMLRREMNQVDRLVGDPLVPVDANIVDMVEEAICGTDPHQMHRMEILVYGSHELKQIEDNLLRDLHIEMRRQTKRELGVVDGLEREKLQARRERRRYNTLRQLYGISLARGSLRQAKAFALDLMEFPVSFGRYGHTVAITTMLNNGGYDALTRRMSFSPRNPYWRRNLWGSHDHPGRVRVFWQKQVEDLTTNPLTGAVYGAAGMALYALWRYLR